MVELEHAQPVDVTVSYNWYEGGALPIPTRKVGRLIRRPIWSWRCSATGGGRSKSERVRAAFAANGCCLIALDDGGLTGDPVRDMIEVLIAPCARLYRHRPTRNRVLKAESASCGSGR
jgi:predicted site-specific integrase-resolvase